MGTVTREYIDMPLGCMVIITVIAVGLPLLIWWLAGHLTIGWNP